MWCDNCLLIFPLRGGGIAWGVFIFAYSLAGGIFLFKYGNYFFFIFPEWQIYGGISMAIMSAAALSILAFSNRSYIWTRVMKFLWPFIIVVSAIRTIFMMIELQRGRSNIQWECDNGGQQWISPSSANQTTVSPLPSSFCAAGFSSLNTAFIFGMLIDIACQIYLYFMVWRFQKLLERRVQYGPIYTN